MKKARYEALVFAQGRARLVCSAGRRGVQVSMAGDDFLAASGAASADLIED